MSANNVPVVAAVPNYNMAPSLGELLPQLTAQNYADIFVLDDASSDESRDVVAGFSEVKFVASTEKAGAGGNRNRILNALGHSTIIHFIDADMSISTLNAPEIAQDVLSERAGLVGGLIRKMDGLQHFFNYGPRHCLKNNLGAVAQMHVNSVAEKDLRQASALRERFLFLLRDWPDVTSLPRPRKTFWSAEGNFVIHSDVFRAVGGFDPRLLDHEIQDLALRLHYAGLEQRFDPALEAVHKAVQVRSGNRSAQMIKAELQIIQKHGLSNWLLPKL